MNIVKNITKSNSIACRLLRGGVSAVFSAFALVSALAPAALSQAEAVSKSDTIRIMPVGDSITFGMGDNGGYRKFLDYFMKEKGYTGIDFVGPEGQNSASFSYNGKQVSYDDNHAGYSGFQIKQPASWGQDSSLYNKLKEKNAVKQAKPDVVLLIIGTNDMTANRSMDDCASDLKDLVNYMLGDMPSGGKVFMGSIPEFTAYGGTDGRVTRYNSTVKKVADEMKNSGKNVEFADVHGCLNGTADLGFDGLHPNGTGYEKMGKFWAETLDDYFSASDNSQPVATTQPDYPQPATQPSSSQQNSSDGSRFGISDKNQPVKIMPLGDSITFGMADEGGYRKFLSYFMQQKGYTKVDLVGPEGKDSASFNYNGKQVSYDDNHAGYSGYTITDLPGGWFGKLNGILETMQKGDYIRKFSPDIILLQIGTNDVSNGHLDGSEERLHQLLDYLRENMPSNGIIFLTTIPDLGNTGFGANSNGDIAKYNQLIKKVADDYNSKNVIYADIHSVIDGSKDLADGVHPNAGGYEKMGKYWADMLDDYLSSSAPVVTTTTTTVTTTTTTTTTTEIPTTTTTAAPVASMPGDVNLDSRITLGDALAILQFIANEDKYPLNDVQQANADVFGGNDGITGNDAVVIQMVDTGAISPSDLPVPVDTDLFSK